MTIHGRGLTIYLHLQEKKMLDSTQARRLAPFFAALLIASLVGCAEQADNAEAPAQPEAAETTETANEAPTTEGESTEDAAAVAGGALNIDEQGRGIRGFDAVAYHNSGEAVAGDEGFNHDWNGVTWLFASAENRDAFAAEPERYAPQNGGYCTFGVILKKKLDVDPEVFLVDEDRLFLFLNPEVKDKFLADKEGNMGLIAAQWPEIADKQPDELASADG